MKQPAWNPGASAAVNARRQLPRLMAQYFREVREALADEPSPAHLHQIRLASKKIRYTLELFEPCYGPEFARRMESLKDVQTSLGDVNDAVAANGLLRDVMPSTPQRKTLRAYLKTRAAEKAEEFRVHWTQKFDAPGEEQRWLAFLRKPRKAPIAGKARKPRKPNPSAAAGAP